jgi:SpoVK/Ycf46/Vps4 family AAA+-type ATPase
METVEKLLHALPDQVNLNSDKRWQIRYKKTVSGSDMLEAVGIKPNLKGELIKDQEENRNIPPVSFSDIGGIDDVIQSIREVIELPLKRPELFRYMGIKPHKGILLYGPPGCGKTMIAKAIANEINAHFIAIKGPELLNKYLGESEANLRSIFSDAREKQPSIIFFDEIDAIAQKRSSNETLRSESRFVTQLLSLMDGIEDYGKVCVIASTNRHESLDIALLRPGRFDYTIFINKPTKKGCRDIFRIKTRDMPLSSKIDDEQFAEKLHGLTGAEIDFVVREAAYNCLRRSLDLRKCIATDNNYKINLNKLRIVETDLEQSLIRVKTMQNRELTGENGK